MHARIKEANFIVLPFQAASKSIIYLSPFQAVREGDVATCNPTKSTFECVKLDKT